MFSSRPDTDETMALFSLTQQRPFTNEVKLAHMNKLTTYQANRVGVEEGKLVVGFEEVGYEAVVSVEIAPAYITFTVEELIVHPWDEKKPENGQALYARAEYGVKLLGTKAALIVCPTASFMDVMEGFEEDFDLPRDVKSRRYFSVPVSKEVLFNAFKNGKIKE